MKPFWLYFLSEKLENDDMPKQSINYLHITQLISKEELSLILNLISQANFKEGKISATGSAADVKHNFQINAEQNFQAQQIGQIISQAISRNRLIQSLVMPKIILPPLVSRYEQGMQYGMHVDSPLMGNQLTIRTDVGMTLFLSDPDTYEGGALEVQTETGAKEFKLPVGDAIIYPTTRLHRVLPVCSGSRLAIVTWMQCVVRDASKREILNQLRKVLESLSSPGNTQKNQLHLQQVYSNLLRMWAEL